jgi:hypothetical protein
MKAFSLEHVQDLEGLNPLRRHHHILEVRGLLLPLVLSGKWSESPKQEPTGIWERRGKMKFILRSKAVMWEEGH